VAEARPRHDAGDPSDGQAYSAVSDQSASSPEEQIRVELSVPADTAYVPVLRTVSASLAARREFTIEEIDDLRVAVDEACALLLPHAAGGQLTARFTGTPDVLTVTVSVRPLATFDAAIDQTSFAWMVLTALADRVHTLAGQDELCVEFVKFRGTFE
jgi:serine/threonine-protein kinase RsbW